MAASQLPVAQQRPYDLGAIPTAGAARWASAGHLTLVANLWWLRAVQYMGDPHADARGWEKLFPALDLVTELDPQHGYAYQVGGNTLGSVGRIDESNAILEKGTRNIPTRYILPFHRAVNEFLYLGDYAEAGRWFEKAARTPGAPVDRMRGYAAAMYVKGNASKAAIAFLSHLYRNAEDDESRRAIQKQIDQVLLEQDAAMLERAAAIYEARHGFRPFALPLLVVDGLVQAIPNDPFGGMYRLDPEGRVRSSANPHRFERPLSRTEREQHFLAPGRTLREMEQSE